MRCSSVRDIGRSLQFATNLEQSFLEWEIGNYVFNSPNSMDIRGCFGLTKTGLSIIRLLRLKLLDAFAGQKQMSEYQYCSSSKTGGSPVQVRSMHWVRWLRKLKELSGNPRDFSATYRLHPAQKRIGTDWDVIFHYGIYFFEELCLRFE